MTPTDNQLSRIREAIAGDHGPDQQRIAQHGLALIHTLLQKNADYGSSAWKPPILAPHLTAREAIQCRMSDKIERFQNLIQNPTPEVNESIGDTMLDFGGYSILWHGAPDP